MRDSILKLIRENGIISFNDIIYALELQTEYQEAAKQIAFLQMEGFVTYIQGEGYKAR
nr:MAG TPA: FaeA-like protein [Caudoviricetes sp.]